MAERKAQEPRRIQELDDVRLLVDQDQTFQIEFSISELVKKLVPGGGLASNCSGCHGCSGCSM